MTNPLYYCLRRGQAAGAAGGSAPVATITHTKNGTFNLTMKGTAGAVVYCDPGNGDPVVEKTLNGNTSIYFSYVNDGTPRLVRLYGDVDQIKYLDLYAMSVTAVNLKVITSPAFYRLSLGSNNITNLDSIHLIKAFTYLAVNANPLVYTTRPWPAVTTGTFYFHNTVTTSDEVDQWLIDLNTALWSNCTIYIDGTNPAPTAAATAALAGLASRGCTVYTN